MEPVASNPMLDPMAAAVAMPQEPALSPEMQPEMIQPEPEPVDPVAAAIDSLLDTPGPDAVRRVYQLATSAARAKAKISAMSDRLDARGYHDALAANPEARYARELIDARRELDVLAAERRRLNLETVKARETNRPTSIYELQSEAATKAMEQVALGVLLFLALPSATINTGGS